jgi:isoaspartyl peptidase/L-asparaginase-like protein (Ntn-hydrolase superfamily)
VGDIPVPGAALYVGPNAAVFVTGHGEAILDKLLARATYDKLVAGSSSDEALAWALSDADAKQLAVAIVDERGVALAPKTATAWAMLAPALRTSAEGD